MKNKLIGAILILFIVSPLESSTGHEKPEEMPIKTINRYELIKNEVIVNSFFNELRKNKEDLETLKTIIKSK
jgi:hypothetical protein